MPIHFEPIADPPADGGPPEQYRTELVTVLNHWAELARAGQLVSLSMVGLSPNGQTTVAFSGLVSPETLIGSVEHLSHRLKQSMWPRSTFNAGPPLGTKTKDLN